MLLFIAPKTDLDLGFIVGASGAKGFEMLEKQKKIIKHMLQSYDVAPSKTHVGVIQKGLQPKIAIKLGQFKELLKLESAINQLGVNDAGRMVDSLRLADEKMFSSSYGGRPGYKKSLVVFVDKKIEEDKEGLEEAGKSLKNNGVNVIVIDLDEAAGKEDLKGIAPLNHVFFFPPLLDDLDMVLYPIVRAVHPGMYHISTPVKEHSGPLQLPGNPKTPSENNDLSDAQIRLQFLHLIFSQLLILSLLHNELPSSLTNTLTCCFLSYRTFNCSTFCKLRLSIRQFILVFETFHRSMRRS